MVYVEGRYVMIKTPSLFGDDDDDDGEEERRYVVREHTRGPGKVRHDHPDTAHDAAEQITPTKAQCQARVLAVLRSYPDGLTDDEMQRMLSMNPNTQRPRRVELVEAELVYATDERRPTASGRRAIVWKAINEGERGLE